LNDRIDGTALQDRLVAAYVLGEFVGEDTFNTLPMCDASDAVGCVASWATVRDGARPAMACGSADLSECIKPTINTHSTPVCTNPLTWELGGQAAASMNLGAGPGRGMGSGLLDPLYPGLVDARCADDGTLRIDDTLESGEMRASQFADVDGGDYHVQDLNLFWLNVRENAAERAAAYLD
jgi:hypothetical protein